MTERRAELELKLERLEDQIVWDSVDKPLSLQIDQARVDLETCDSDSCEEDWS
jgi:hypothetical protein